MLRGLARLVVAIVWTLQGVCWLVVLLLLLSVEWVVRRFEGVKRRAGVYDLEQGDGDDWDWDD